MQGYRISIESIDEGLDRKHLHDLKRRFGQVNEERYTRTRSALAQRQKIFLDLLTLLFHTNHPMLPGYVSRRTPSGVQGYKPSAEQLRLAQNLARSFRHNRNPHQKCDILALFLMGSVGTVAHSESSDLDIWVCYQPGLNRTGLAALDRKCLQLGEWAEQLGLEAHFFLMDGERFLNDGGAAFGNEGSGSAQRYLLLDEFYRTGLLLAGRAPLWWFVPSVREADYCEYTQTLLSKRFMPAIEVINFGGVSHIPDGEFIGAGVWQLYKGIESPYKSVLKLMLLECYASEYPTIIPLSLTFKEAIYSGRLNVNELDPYVMVYRRLERYLLQRRESKRLELLRRCFYFKVNKPLTKAPSGRKKSWQRKLLESLVAQWGWDKRQLAQLDARPRWKAQRVMSEHKLLVNELTNSYRFLMDFARQTHANAAIRADELNVLGRKLHAAFERRAGKIDWINPHISPDLSEVFVTLVQESRGTDGQKVFSAYAQAASDTPYRRQQRLKQSRDIVELLVWCHCNGVLTTSTRYELVAEPPPLSPIALRQTIQSIQRWLTLPLPAVTHESFLQQARTRAVLLLINVGTDPEYQLHQQGIYRISDHIDPLGFSSAKESLVGNIALVSINSWNEVNTHHFNRQALVTCLLHYLRITPRGQPLPELSIRCVSASRATSISQRVEELFRDLSTCFYAAKQSRWTRYLFELSGNYYCVQFIDEQPHISQHANSNELVQHLGQTQNNYSPIVVDRSALQGHPLRTIAPIACDSAIHVFYLPLEDSKADIYIVDEKGSVLKMCVPFLNPQTLLRPLHRFIRSAIERLSMDSDQLQQAFGIYPVDFYELKTGPRGVTHCERRRVNTELNRLYFFNIQVIADCADNGKPSYRIYCDQQEFSEMEFGEKLFETVARHILAQRHGAKRYPCYITDMDLSQCRPYLAPQGGLQVSHYLQIKTQLEQRLNAALEAL